MKLNFLPFVSRPLIFAALGISIPTMLVAQGTLYVSSLGDQVGSLPVYSTQWLAQGFETGNNATGYTLNSVQVPMTAAVGSPTGFTLSIYSAAGALPAPSQLMGVLSGSANPASAGAYTYDASGITLAPLTDYFFVETATSAYPQAYYEWSQVSSDAELLGGWQILPGELSSDQGADWSLAGRSALQVAIYATAVPEPRVWALLCAGAAVVWTNRKRFAS